MIDQSEEFYVGYYTYYFQTDKTTPEYKIIDHIIILFSIKKDNIHIITTEYDNETLEKSDMTMDSMLDVDGCGKAEVIVLKSFGGTAGGQTHMEIYKHKADGSWARIQKIKSDYWGGVAYERSRYEAKNAELAKKYAKNVKLPDGLYMYDSWVKPKEDGSYRVGFAKYFVVYSNKIYGSIEAYKKFGVFKLTTLFGMNKTYKILCGGKVVGTKYNLIFEKEEGVDSDDAYLSCVESLCEEFYNTKDIKQGPAYVANKYSRIGSATKCLAAPEAYKEVKKKVYTTIPQEEVDKIVNLAKEKLLPLVINRKELKQYKIKSTELVRGNLQALDKISYNNNEFYIGTYGYGFATPEDTYSYEVVFSVNQDNVAVITTQYDDETADYDGNISLYGMLDVDGCGEEELIMEKVSYGEDESRGNISIYKRKTDGNWERIQKVIL